MKIKLNNNININSDYGKNLLISRGVKDIELFLNPIEYDLQDFNDLDNIWEGVELIKNLTSNSKVGLIVDCDVDGYTSAAIIYQYLKLYIPSINITFYIHEGKAHGLEEHWKEIRGCDYDLIIIPDAGSNDKLYAEQIDSKILVIDHHNIKDMEFSNNMVVINNQLSDKYKNKFLSGAGMVYQFCRALDSALNKNLSKNFIDLAALGVCGDMMSGLEVENQSIWKTGFNNIQNSLFKEMCEKQSYSMQGVINPLSVAFYIVPLINAMVRVGTMEEKTRMFMAFCDGETLVPSNKRGEKGKMVPVKFETVRECTNAKSRQNRMKANVVDTLTQRIFKYDLLNNPVLFIKLEDDDDFPSELNGLVATELSQDYKRPTIVARLNDEGYVRGSARGLSNSSINSFQDFIDESTLFEYALGHENAFGISISNDNIDRFLQYAKDKIDSKDLLEKYYDVDFIRRCDSNDLRDMIFDLDKYKSYWATENKEPVINVTGIHLEKKDVSIMGKNQDTIKFVINGITYIKFFAKDLIEEINELDNFSIEIVGKAGINEWMGNYTPQIIIEGYEIKKDNLLDF